ncbi:MAG: hypothetical protein AAGI44_05575 [Pseudomonadota bacterium]
MKDQDGANSTEPDSPCGVSKGPRPYTTPRLTRFGDLRDLSKGTVAYSLEEGLYQEMNPPS